MSTSLLSAVILALMAAMAKDETRPRARVFVEESVKALRAQTAAHSAAWHLDEVDEWSADQDAGVIIFDLPGGVRAEAPFQIVGTYDSLKGTFLWAWDHPSVEPGLRKHAQLAREWGKAQGLRNYTTRLVSCSEDEAWEFTAVAARLGKANGAYRGPSGTTYVFMTYGEIKLQKR